MTTTCHLSVQQTPDDPRGTRRRYVTVASAAAHAEWMADVRSGREGQFVPFRGACRALAVSRNKMSERIGLGWIAGTMINRRQHVGLVSLCEYAGSRGLTAMAARRPSE